MTHRVAALAGLVVLLGDAVVAQGVDDWRDPSSHRVTFVTVAADVSLEVLDWGGSGPPVVLLAGAGHSAHVFDDFAPKLTSAAHVLAITRRGWGASSQPESGYDNQRLADDLFQALNVLKFERAIVVGHSAAGHEMTTWARQHPERVAGLVYLDALNDSESDPALEPEWLALARQLPPPTPRSCAEDRTSFAAFREFRRCTTGFALPEGELRSTFRTNPDGSVGPFTTRQAIHRAMGEGHRTPRDYAGIRAPVVALFEFPRTSLDQLRPEDPQPRNDEERALLLKVAAIGKRIIDRAAEKLRRSVPAARIVDLPGAGHYVFITREDDVIREIAQLAKALR